MAKNCLIYETLNGVKELKTQKTDEGLMTLSGVFGVCGVRNNNQRVYETSNYSKMVTEMQERIKAEGGIPGELEHPQLMNITLENISHKITDINIDENGVVTGSITLLNTPKGKIAQAIVEGGLPLFISSRATGQVDAKNGNVTLEKIATYDLVGSPGFSQAKLHLNENQVAESINESMVFYIGEKDVEETLVNENNEIDFKENNIDEMEELDDLIESKNHFKLFDYMLDNVDELLTKDMIIEMNKILKIDKEISRIEGMGQYDQIIHMLSCFLTNGSPIASRQYTIEEVERMGSQLCGFNPYLKKGKPPFMERRFSMPFISFKTLSILA